MDGDAEYNRIKTVLEQGLKLAEVDLLKLILLPLMKSQQPEAEMTIKAAQLAKSANSKLTDFVIGSIIAITDKFLPEALVALFATDIIFSTLGLIPVNV